MPAGAVRMHFIFLIFMVTVRKAIKHQLAFLGALSYHDRTESNHEDAPDTVQ